MCKRLVFSVLISGAIFIGLKWSPEKFGFCAEISNVWDDDDECEP